MSKLQRNQISVFHCGSHFTVFFAICCFLRIDRKSVLLFQYDWSYKPQGRDTCLLIRTDKQLQWSRESFFSIPLNHDAFNSLNVYLLILTKDSCVGLSPIVAVQKIIHNSFPLFKSQIPLVSSIVLTVKCNPIKIKHTFRRNHTTL